MRARVVASILVLSAVLAPPADATFAGRNGDLAFTSRVQEEGACNDMAHHFDCGPIFGNLYLAHNGRGEAHQVTHCDAQRPCDLWGPAFSPDGRRLAYTSAGSVYVARADGSHPRLVAEESIAPAWSPGGRELAVAKADGIYRVRLRDGRVRRVTSRSDGDPDWSSRGRIAFVRAFPSELQGIYTVDADGGHEERLTASYESGPTWAPDGKRLAYNGTGGLTVARIGGGVHVIPGPGGPSAWSPDGRLLAAPTGQRITVLRPTGALVRAVPMPEGVLTGLAWQPRR